MVKRNDVTEQELDGLQYAYNQMTLAADMVAQASAENDKERATTEFNLMMVHMCTLGIRLSGVLGKVTGEVFIPVTRSEEELKNAGS